MPSSRRSPTPPFIEATRARTARAAACPGRGAHQRRPSLRPLVAPEPADGRLSSHYSRASLTLQTASCYIEAGQPARAAGLYHEVLRNKLLSRRDQGYFTARRAYSLALAGRPDEAATIGLASVRLADATNSMRTKRELRRVVRTLGPWATRPGPRELGEALRA